MKLKYNKVCSNAKIQAPVHPGDVGYDIHTTSTHVIDPGKSKILGTGIRLEIPEGYYATIETRSKHGISHSLRAHRGIIDAGYRGEVTIKMYNSGALPYAVMSGDRIAQLTLHKAQLMALEEVGELAESVRGEKGFGSTGN